MDQLAGRDRGLDRVEEADELLVPVPLHAPAQHRAVEHVQGREQRRRAVALVVVGRGRRPTLLHRQPRLGAVERLDLGFLVDREHDRVRRRVHVEPDHVAQLGDERRVPGELEGAHPMRGEPVRLPDALHRAQARCWLPWPSSGRSSGSPRRAARPGLARRRGRRGPAAAVTCQACWLLSRSRPATPSCANRSRQRRTEGRERPAQRPIAVVPWPSAAARATLARQTCFCGLFRSATIASSRRRSAGLTWMVVPDAWRRVPHRPTEWNAMSASGHSDSSLLNPWESRPPANRMAGVHLGLSG